MLFEEEALVCGFLYDNDPDEILVPLATCCGCSSSCRTVEAEAGPSPAPGIVHGSLSPSRANHIPPYAGTALSNGRALRGWRGLLGGRSGSSPQRPERPARWQIRPGTICRHLVLFMAYILPFQRSLNKMFESIHGSPGAGFDCQCQLGAARVHSPSSPDGAFPLVVVPLCALGHLTFFLASGWPTEWWRHQHQFLLSEALFLTVLGLDPGSCEVNQLL